MARHDAVDRLMALAMEKRADRTPEATLPGLATAGSGTGAGGATRLLTVAPPAGGQSDSTPEEKTEAALPTAAGGRQLLETVLPLLPALGGVMRLVDHGVVQAAVKIFMLLGGVSGQPGGATRQAAPSPEQERLVRAVVELQTMQQTTRKEVDLLGRQVAAVDDLFGRIRNQIERFISEQQAKDSELHSLGEKVRLLSAGMIILLLLIVAQMILLVVMMHK